jgi:hypothetical protein
MSSFMVLVTNDYCGITATVAARKTVTVENGDSALFSAPILLPSCEAWIPGSASPPRNDEDLGKLATFATVRDY